MTTPPDPVASAPSILIIEDEADLLELLRYNLGREGYAAAAADTGEEGLKLARAAPPGLILLDLMLPGMDGLEVCRELKSRRATVASPVIMLTAKGEEADIVRGLELGADDYITKPFSPRVLLARIKAVLRRAERDAEAGGDRGDRGEAAHVLSVGDVTLDLDRHAVTALGQPVELTAAEFKLLGLLLKRPGRVFTRQQIIEAVHDGMAAVTDRSVDVQVVALRRKLGEAGANVQTLRGVGYRFKEP